MTSLVAQDALLESVVPVKPTDFIAAAERPAKGGFYAVANTDGMVEMVPAHKGSSATVGSFAELLEGDNDAPIAANLSLPEVLKKFRISGKEALPVYDENGRFLGAITQRSILDALLKRERELIRKSREFRQSATDDKGRHYEAMRRLEQVNQAFKKLLGTLARPPGPDMFQRGLEAVAGVCKAEYAALHLLDESGRGRETIRTGAVPGGESRSADWARQRWLLLEPVVRDNRILSLPRNEISRHLGSAGADTKGRAITSFLGVPISREGHVFGCVYICNKHAAHAFADEDEELLASFAGGVALTLAQAREISRRRRAERERDMLARMGLRLTTAITVGQLAEAVRSTTEDFWKWDAFSLSVRRSGHGIMHRVMEIDHLFASDQKGESEENDPAGEAGKQEGPVLAPSRPHGISGMLSIELHARLAQGECVLINRNLNEPGPELDRFGDVSRPSSSMLFAPMLVEGALVGIVSVQSYHENRLKESDRDLLQRLAEVVGPALRRCQAERRSEAFLSLGHRLSMVTQPEEAAQVIVQVADQLIGWDACSVYLYDAAANMASNVLHMDLVDGKRQEIKPEAMEASPGILPTRTIREGPQLVLRKEPKFEPTEAMPFGDRSRPSASLMFVPLRVGTLVTGLLSIQSYTLDEYDEGDLRLLQALADHCSGALERMRLQQSSKPKRVRSAPKVKP